MSTSAHDKVILDQFTRQTIPFAEAPIHRDGMDLMLEMSGVSRDDQVLDVACGPGLVACAFAERAGHVTGVDLTPSMIDEARRLQQTRGLDNLTWQVGSAVPLPFADETFSLVITRYTFHHFEHPARALDEMFRVCRRGGRVLVADLSIPSPQGERFDAVEQLRDPSHVRALPPDELRALFTRADSSNLRDADFGLHIELEPQLARSFPVNGGPDRIRRAYEESIADDRLGIRTRRLNGSLWSTWPIKIVVATKR
jgi:ubiquinone/menaquinone biosynthesis C-methylase UbiE